VKIKNIKIDNNLPFTLIAGPCSIEGLDHALYHAEKIKEICESLCIPLIYKSSFDKANRTSLSSNRGVGIEEGLKILEQVKNNFNIPVLTDVHESDQCKTLSEVVDVIQIPAFLCRQTDLLVAAAKTSCAINVKKGQFLAPWDIHQVVKKIETSGSKKILLTERGTSFGYNTLISDMRSIPEMASTGYPVIFDATHSVQQPGGKGSSSGGERKYVETLSKASIAVGVAGLFVETHRDPDNAPSDGPNMIPLNELKSLLILLKRYDQISKNY
tara:strand:- start:654 stop:1466 length:813 start_codon:yes stop_codon:yes gene_type:complete